MFADIKQLDCCGKTIWRIMATQCGRLTGLGHMLDCDSLEEAILIVRATARRMRVEYAIGIYYTPGHVGTAISCTDPDDQEFLSGKPLPEEMNY